MAKKKAAKKAPAKKSAPKKSKPVVKKSKPARKAAAPKAAAAPAKPSTAARDRALGQFKFAHGVTVKFASNFPDDLVTAQPPSCPNHLLWTLGHLASTASWMAGLVDGQPHTVPETYEKMFGMGSTPVNDPAAYPPFAEVRAAFDATYERLLTAAERMNDEQLAAPPAADGGGFVNDKLDALFKAAWHESWHLGQLANLRRALNLPSAFG